MHQPTPVVMQIVLWRTLIISTKHVSVSKECMLVLFVPVICTSTWLRK